MLYPKLHHRFATAVLQHAISKTYFSWVTGEWFCRNQGSLGAACRGHCYFCLPSLGVLYKSLHLPETLFLLPLWFLGGFACLECEQFRAGPLHRRTNNLRWAPWLFAAHVASRSSNNGPAPVTCDTCSSFAGCWDADVSLSLAQRRDCMFVAIRLQYSNYWRGCKHWISFWSHPCFTLTLPGSCVTAPSWECPFLAISCVELIRTPHLPL